MYFITSSNRYKEYLIKDDKPIQKAKFELTRNLGNRSMHLGIAIIIKTMLQKITHCVDVTVNINGGLCRNSSMISRITLPRSE